MFRVGVRDIKHAGVICGDKNGTIGLVGGFAGGEEGSPVEVGNFLDDRVDEFRGVTRRAEVGPKFTYTYVKAIVPGANATNAKGPTVDDGPENMSRMTGGRRQEAVRVCGFGVDVSFKCGVAD